MQGNMVDRKSTLSPEMQAQLDKRLRARSTSNRVTKTIPLRRREDVAPLSFAQQRLWFLDKLEPESCTYKISRALKIEGPLNVDALKQALNAIVARHESLRTTFDTVNGQPVIVIAQTLDASLRAIDLAALPEREQEIRVRDLSTKEKTLSFNLCQGPLFRVLLVRLGEVKHVLLVTTHHIVSDGWSIELFFAELNQTYDDSIRGSACSLPELPIQYSDFALWQRRWLQGEVLAKHLQYWREQLRGAPALLELPTDHPRPAVQSHRGAQHAVAFSIELLKGLKQLSRREGVTLFMTLLAAFNTLLSRYSHQDDIVVGSPIAGRNRTELEGLIGFFASTLTLRTDLSGDPTFRQLLGRVREVTLGAYDHQGMPFEKLVEDLHPERSLSYNPLFQVLFGLHNIPTQAPSLPGLKLSPIEIEISAARFDLSLDLEERPDGLTGLIEYSTDLFESETIDRMAGHLQTLLETVVANSEQRLSVLPLLIEREQQQILRDWNNTSTEHQEGQCIHQVFEARVDHAPEAVALVFEDEQLTYGELDRRANRLAHHLQTLGVRPDVRVGICVERSLEMVIGLLGILKAGGAYVPLDPAYPAERLAFMLEDADARVLLTQRHLVEMLHEEHAEIVCLDDSRWGTGLEQPGTGRD